MEYFLPAFYFSLSFTGLMIGLVLILRSRSSLAYAFFGTYNLITAWGFFVSFLLASGLILEFPHFFRTAAPLHYLWGPLCYLFIRNLLTSENRFYKTDLLHFLPFLLHFIELIPFYVSSTEFKIGMLKSMFAEGDRYGVYEGLLTSYWHSMLKFSSMLIYNFFQWKLFFNFINTRNQSFKESNQLVINWVIFVNISGLIMSMVSLYHKFIMTRGELNVINLPDSIFYIYYILIWYYLIFKPKLLLGVKLSKVVPEKEKKLGSASNLSSRRELRYDELIKKIETYMQVNQPFLNDELNLTMLAANIYSPEHRVSKAIKYKFGVNFSEYVSRYRIDYIEENILKNPEWENYTVEGMAFSAGFNSRNAFYNAFRKIKGITPTEYFKSKGLRF